MIGIVGMGLMGTSLALRLQENGQDVLGFDIQEDTLSYCRSLDLHVEKDLDSLSQCSLVLLALYPQSLFAWLEQYQDKLAKDALVLEISGVKSNLTLALQEKMKEKRELISIHPMCGRQSRGPEFASSKIFDQANYIVIPTHKNSDTAIEKAKEIGNLLKVGHISTLSVEEHDHMIAFLSQLTHVIAVSLMNTHDNTHLVEYTGDSFRDLTRIAEINEDLWSELFLWNKEILLEEIDAFQDALSHFKEALQKEDVLEMKHLFRQSTQRRKEFDKSR